MKTARTLFSIFALALILVAGCAPQTKPATAVTPSSDLSARTFASEEELITFIEDHQGGSDYYYRRGGVLTMAAESAVAPSPAKSADSAAGSAGADYSGTNNQVAGVDEADILKTDGKYIYTVTGNTLFIVDAYPGETAAVVATLNLTGQPNGLFVDGDTLAVFGYFYDTDYFSKMDIKPYNGMTFLTIYDISDRASPVVKKEYKFEGNYFQGRMQDGTAYLLVTTTPNLEYPTPIIYEGTVRSSVALSDIRYYPIPYNNPQFVTVHAVNMDDGDLDSTTVAVEGANTLYMSEQNMYIAYTEYVNEWEIRQDITKVVLEDRLTAEEKQLINKINAVDSDVLSKAEKDAKIWQVYEQHLTYTQSEERSQLEKLIDKQVQAKLDDYEAMEYTIIHKLTLGEDGIAIGETGRVPGHLNNQFSLDEYNGVLRVATSTSPRWGWIRPMMVDDAMPIEEGAGDTAVTEPAIAPDEKIAPPEMGTSESVNAVYALDANMKVIGKLGDLAKGEQIFSTRFMGDRLYMVTFRQVDPFFVIDLSDPTDIKELGTLKLPGFSRYLHPYDENTVIGIGRDATDTGRQQGLKISLFDVSDVSKPKEIAQWVSKEEYAQSTAEWEHKAFLFDKEKELLVLPVYSYSWDEKVGTSKEQYNGAMVFHITRDDIEMRGIVDHSIGTQYWGSLVERSLYIEELLYTKSPSLLRINALDDLRGVQNITLSAPGSGPYPVY
jgi:inhibitor of cysteine peptidase